MNTQHLRHVLLAVIAVVVLTASAAHATRGNLQLCTRLVGNGPRGRVVVPCPVAPAGNSSLPGGR